MKVKYGYNSTYLIKQGFITLWNDWDVWGCNLQGHGPGGPANQIKKVKMDEGTIKLQFYESDTAGFYHFMD